ncbi:MAG: NUDIX domain-containing protein [Candidatus Dojkabacteria bacterium]|nr:NUDIX domain-containing protein [Candidatus Dojkabacteria bacterium]
MPTKPVPIEPPQIKYIGRIFRVTTQRMKIGDKQTTFEFVDRSPGVRLIFVSHDKKILLTKEHRHEFDDYDYRLPGGKVFDTLLEYTDFLDSKKNMLNAAQKAAIQEAREEAGIKVEQIKHITTSHSGATIKWDLYYFLVSKYSEIKSGQKLEDGEDIKVDWFSKEKVKDICLKGEMKEDRSVAVLLRHLDSR